MSKYSKLERGWGGAREGAGHPAYTTETTRQVTIRLPVSQIEELDKQVSREKLAGVTAATRSALISVLVEEGLRKKRRARIRIVKKGKRLGTK